jgi:hypothetical protein
MDRAEQRFSNAQEQVVGFFDGHILSRVSSTVQDLN